MAFREWVANGLKIMTDLHENDKAKLEKMQRPWHPWDILDTDYVEEAHHRDFRKFFEGSSGLKGENAQTMFRLDWEPTRHLKSAFNDAKIWNRVWIMQELSCSPSIRLLMPYYELDWQMVSSFLKDSKVREFSRNYRW